MTCRDWSGDIQSYHVLAKYCQMGEYSKLDLRPATSMYIDPPRHLTINRSESLNIIAKILGSSISLVDGHALRCELIATFARPSLPFSALWDGLAS